MAQGTVVEQRLAVLEKEVAELKHGMAQVNSSKNWFERIAGSFKDDPEFEEVLKLGRAIRQAHP